MGSFGSHGYGNAYVRKQRTAHRVSYEAFNGAIPDGAFVCHTCDVRACVNPEHLKLGDQASNMDDVSRGKYHPKRKLTSEEVREIRGSGDPQRVLAIRYNVTQRAIWMVMQGRTYRHD